MLALIIPSILRFFGESETSLQIYDIFSSINPKHFIILDSFTVNSFYLFLKFILNIHIGGIWKRCLFLWIENKENKPPTSVIALTFCLFFDDSQTLKQSHSQDMMPEVVEWTSLYGQPLKDTKHHRTLRSSSLWSMHEVNFIMDSVMFPTTI